MRVRVRYSKLGKIRFLGHRDVARGWERALRRAGLRVTYSEGFSPRPRVHFGLALSTGYESVAEYVEFDLVDFPHEVTLESLPPLLSAVLPDGIDCVGVAETPVGSRSLQDAVDSCEWRIQIVEDEAPELSRRIEAALEAPELHIEIERKGKLVQVDVRPQIVAMRMAPSTRSVATSATSPVVEVELATKPRSVRPQELIDVVFGPIQRTRVTRLAQWTNVDGHRAEPVQITQPTPALRRVLESAGLPSTPQPASAVV